MPEDHDSLPQSQVQGFVRHENFESWYANNIQFHPSEYDLKLIFGEIDWPPTGVPVVQQHTAISMSWVQAKLTLYFLAAQVGVYEILHGAIKVPPTVMPSEAEPPTDDNPLAKQAYEFIKQKREELMK